VLKEASPPVRHINNLSVDAEMCICPRTLSSLTLSWELRSIEKVVELKGLKLTGAGGVILLGQNKVAVSGP